MYCINCGVKLADTEHMCPLCQADPTKLLSERMDTAPLYPSGCHPDIRPKRGAINGTILAAFLLSLLVTFLVDWQSDGKLNWFGYSTGGLLLGYVVLALPRWFYKPNPVIFVPCDFAAAALYLLYIDLATAGGWFLSFAFPVTAVLCGLAGALAALLRYTRGGRLYIFGGAFMALGGFLLLLEVLLSAAFARVFSGWSLYPLTVLILLGGWLIFLAINHSVREKMERKFFF